MENVWDCKTVSSWLVLENQPNQIYLYCKTNSAFVWCVCVCGINLTGIFALFYFVEIQLCFCNLSAAFVTYYVSQHHLNGMLPNVDYCLTSILAVQYLVHPDVVLCKGVFIWTDAYTTTSFWKQWNAKQSAHYGVGFWQKGSWIEYSSCVMTQL